MNDTIRVAMIIHSYFPRVGGAERQLAALAPLLQALNVDLHILTRRYPDLPPYERIDGVPVHRLPVPGPKAVASLSFSAAGVQRLIQLRPDIIHAHDLRSPTTTAIAAKRLLKVPVVSKVLRGGLLGDLRKLHKMPFGRQRWAWFRDRIDAFITISGEIDEELATGGIAPARRYFVPNGVDIERFVPLDSDARREQRLRLGLPDVPTAIFTGRLAAEKRIDQLIAIWPEVREEIAGAQLWLLGTGPEEAGLKTKAGAGVHFLGVQDDVVPYLQAADIFVLPSATEGLSNSMLEAMATGLPAVVTEVGGAVDLVEQGQSGCLVPPDNSAQLRGAIVALLQDDARRESIGRRARERIIADYALPVTAQRLRALYERLTASPLIDQPHDSIVEADR